MNVIQYLISSSREDATWWRFGLAASFLKGNKSNFSSCDYSINHNNNLILMPSS